MSGSLLRAQSLLTSQAHAYATSGERHVRSWMAYVNKFIFACVPLRNELIYLCAALPDEQSAVSVGSAGL